MSKLHIKKGDSVVVLNGKDKGKKGKVLSVDPKNSTAVVEGVNMCVKHKKPRKQGEVGGIIHQEVAVTVCKLMHICDKCGKPTRIGRTTIEDGKHVRMCKHCKEII